MFNIMSLIHKETLVNIDVNIWLHSPAILNEIYEEYCCDSDEYYIEYKA